MSAFEPQQLPLGIAAKDSNSFANFFAGPNAEVVAHLTSAPDTSGSRVGYLWGPAGVGKTHLLHALCHTATQRGDAAAYLPLSGYQEWNPDIVEGMEHCRVICLDDVTAVAGNAAWEEALFHLFNRTAELGHAFFCAAREVPEQMAIQLADLRSRLKSGLVLQLVALTEAETVLALQQRAQGRGFELPDDVATYLLRRCPRDTTSLFQLLDRLDFASLAAQRRLTIPFVRDLI